MTAGVPGAPGAAGGAGATVHRVGLAIGLVCLSSLTFAVLFAGVKYLDGRYSPVQVLFLRYSIGFAVSLPLIMRLGRGVWRTTRPAAHGVRALYGLISTLLMFYAVTQMPLATATAISFSMPLFLTMLSMPMLGETVGWRRATATAVGFAGVVIVVNPGGDISWAALMALVSALFYALAVIAVRQLSNSEPAARIYIYYCLANIVFCGAALPWFWVAPTPADWAVFAGIGTLGAGAQYCFLIAYRNAPASIIAPFDYLQIFFALAIGYLVWSELPRAQSAIGGAIIVASGLYIWRRETRLAAARRKAPA